MPVDQIAGKSQRRLAAFERTAKQAAVEFDAPHTIGLRGHHDSLGGFIKTSHVSSSVSRRARVRLSEPLGRAPPSSAGQNFGRTRAGRHADRAAAALRGRKVTACPAWLDCGAGKSLRRSLVLYGFFMRLAP